MQEGENDFLDLNSALYFTSCEIGLPLYLYHFLYVNCISLYSLCTIKSIYKQTTNFLNIAFFPQNFH